jgi:hypothetical protein
MEADTQAQVAFFLTGRRPSEYLDAVEGLDLRPALFAGYRDLTPLRYDFPLVLGKGPGPAGVQSLSGVFDDALTAVARGADAERIRKHGLRLEQEIRALVAGGATGSFPVLWDLAADRLAAQMDALFQDSRRRLRAAITADGEVADCDAALPVRLLRQVWGLAQARKAEQFRKKIDRLILKLSDILKSDFEKSAEGLSAQRLQASVGTGYANTFDFQALSTLLGRTVAQEGLPDSRKARINELLRILKTQKFYPAGEQDAAVKPYALVFEKCADALKAYRERLPRLVELARAVVIAELEIDGEYSPERHDVMFESYGATGLDAQELAAFPDLLVCTDAARLGPQEHGRLMEILSSGWPIKVLLQVDDLHEEADGGEGAFASPLRSRQLASLAMGLNDVYVLQSSSSNLFQFRDRVLQGVTYPGPALFSIYSGADAQRSGLAPYLMAAAAMESRAFPAFTYDPSAGATWADRFDLAANTQVQLDWPVRDFAYEDEQHQGVSEDLSFTLVDFLASDRRYAGHLARVPRERWNGSLIRVEESLTRDRRGLPDRVPSLLMVDGDNRLQKVIVDQSLIRQAGRCRDMWHSLQELGGIHNSHAERLLAREQKAWQERLTDSQAPAAPAPSAVLAAATAAPVSDTAAAAAPAEEQRSPDEAYIETARCSTCNECTQINNKMFAYNDNQQAYIADINAGTYAQLVQAAESCQVAIIHPGKPRNADEAGLEDLVKRAEAFN